MKKGERKGGRVEEGRTEGREGGRREDGRKRGWKKGRTLKVGKSAEGSQTGPILEKNTIPELKTGTIYFQ